MQVTYFVEDKLGGVSSLCYNLVDNAPENDYHQTVVHIDLDESDMSRAYLHYPGAENIKYKYSASENQYATIKRLYDILPQLQGALVVNYKFEMEMLDHYPIQQTVYQLVHDEYNFGLAKSFSHVVDVFIAHNKHIYEQLVKALPARQEDIFYLPHGVPVPQFSREPINSQEGGPLRLLFLGRMSRKKGIFDLPIIDQYLNDHGVSVQWTCIGNGPEKEDLKGIWNKESIQFISPVTNEEVLKIASQQDVFVLPTKFEGSPVSLLETMSVGLVPVITDLEGGIREIVGNDIGFRLPMDQNKRFADAIIDLNNNRDLLNNMSRAARTKIETDFSVQNTARAYHDLFQLFKEKFREKELKRQKIGARLDQPWIPPVITKLLRELFSK